MKLRLNGELSIETEFDDAIFNDNLGGINSLVTDIEYQQPMVKTWYYTNISNSEFWVKDSDIPIPVTYSNKLFSSEKLGVYIIKRYNIRYENKFKLNALLRYVLSNVDSTVDKNKDEIAKLITKQLKDIDSYGNNFILRFKYFIPKNILYDHRVVATKNYIIARQLNNITTYENVGEDSSNMSKIMFELKYYNRSNNDLILPIMDTEVILKANKSFGKGKVNITIKDNTEATLIERTYSEEEFKSIGLVNNVSDNKYSDKLAELGITEFKFKSDWLKYIVEHDISLHKLNAYAINEEIANVKLDKEEAVMYKDAIKILKDLIP